MRKDNEQWITELGKSPGTYVRLVRLDEKQLPEHVCMASLHMILPAEQAVCLSEFASQEADSQQGARSRLVYTVPRAPVIEMLEDRSRQGAAYWERVGYPRTDLNKTCFFFSGLEVEEVAGTFIYPT